MGAAFAVSLWLLGCGADRTVEDAALGDVPDGGNSDAAQTWMIATPASPAEPAPADPTPCPDGFTLDATGPRCVGLDATALETCPGATHLVPGRDGCVAVGSACPADGYPTDVPVDAVYVSA